MKPGYQTTEFWVTVLAVLAPIVSVFFKVTVTDQQALAGTIASLITGVSYIAARSYIKK